MILGVACHTVVQTLSLLNQLRLIGAGPDQKPVPHLCHQEPFNCCSETAASGPGGSAIEPRPIPAEQVDGFRFGSVKSKQKPLKRNGKGELTTLSLSGFTRKMSDDTRAYFDSLFDDAT